MSDAEPGPSRALRVRTDATDLEQFEAWLASRVSRGAVTLDRTGPLALDAVVRFELQLADGAPALRGEGRVTGVHGAGPAAGASLKLTRLDARSKALFDAALARARALASQPRFAGDPASSQPALGSLGSLASQPALDSRPASGGPAASSPALAELWRDALGGDGEDEADEFPLPRSPLALAPMPPAAGPALVPPPAAPTLPPGLGGHTGTIELAPFASALRPAPVPALAPPPPAALALEPAPSAPRAVALRGDEDAGGVASTLAALEDAVGPEALARALTRARARAPRSTPLAMLYADLAVLGDEVEQLRKRIVTARRLEAHPRGGRVAPVSLSPRAQFSSLPPSRDDYANLPAVLGLFGEDPNDAQDVWSATGGAPDELRSPQPPAGVDAAPRPRSAPPVLVPHMSAAVVARAEGPMREPTPVPSLAPEPEGLARASLRAPSRAPTGLEPAGPPLDARRGAIPSAPRLPALDALDDAPSDWRAPPEAPEVDPNALEGDDALAEFDAAPLDLAARPAPEPARALAPVLELDTDPPPRMPSVAAPPLPLDAPLPPESDDGAGSEADF